MKPKLTDPPPAEVLEVQRDFDVWRSAHSRRTIFPDALWAAAAKIATQYGIYLWVIKTEFKQDRTYYVNRRQ